MVVRLVILLIGGLLAFAGPAWALSEADTGGSWIQAPFQQKIQVTNVLSRVLGMNPEKLQQCLEKKFADPANSDKTILSVGQECKEEKP